jgi:hypothetical protein
LLGLHPTGLAAPECEHPVTVLFVVLSGIEEPQRHLTLLAQIARLVSAPERVVTLRQAGTAETVWSRLQEELRGIERRSTAPDTARVSEPPARWIERAQGS